MDIRPAVMDDVQDICLLYNEFFTYNANQQPFYYKPAVEKGAYPQSIIESDTEVLFLSTDKDRIIGLIHVMEEKTPPYDCYIQRKYALIMDLYIKEDYRRKGAGSLLLDAAKNWAESRGLDYIELNVLAENENGLRFYEHENFETVSRTMRLKI